jgi:hypothetical protein
VAGFIFGSNGCTSTAQCVATYGAGTVCIHAECQGAGATVCIPTCSGGAAAGLFDNLVNLRG